MVSGDLGINSHTSSRLIRCGAELLHHRRAIEDRGRDRVSHVHLGRDPASGAFRPASTSTCRRVYIVVVDAGRKAPDADRGPDERGLRGRGAILDGAAMVQQFAPQRINRDDVWELIPKITAHHDPEFDKGGSGARNTRMTVHLKDGKKLQQFVEIARTIAALSPNDQIVAKYRTLTDWLVTPQRQADIADFVLNVEANEDYPASCACSLRQSERHSRK